MNIINIGHSMKYENECVTTLFFPQEKIVSSFLSLGETNSYSGDAVITKLSEQGQEIEVTVTAALNGQTETIAGKVPKDAENPKEQCEFLMCRQIYTLLSKLTGIQPAWGVLTGIRPVKLFRMKMAGGMTAEQAVRELSDRFLVSPEKVELTKRTAEAQEPLMRQLSDDRFSLYVSIPFCPSRCSYCSFVSQAIGTKRAKDLLPDYVETLCKEIEYTAKLSKQAGLRLDTVYFGGGTPTTLSADQLRQVCAAIAAHFDLSERREYTVEAGRPDTIDWEKLAALKESGVDRISVNPQTLNDQVLEGIGRNHTARQMIEAFHLARKAGFDNINMDLIAGLPGDTAESFQDTLTQVIQLQPENITVHTLSIKRSSDYGENWEDRKRALQSGETAKEMVSFAQKRLIEAGYRPYYLYKQRNTLGNLENTGYCKPGKECLYNVYIMDEDQTILAVGGGAVTKLKSNRTGALERVFNYKYPFEYISKFDEILKRKDKVVDFFEENRPLPLWDH